MLVFQDNFIHPTGTFIKRISLVLIFSIAMGYLESAVVIYIRELYYPEGFSFPLKVMDERLIMTELFRELATLIMLAGIAWLAGATWSGRFGYFLVAFGIWDIFYYVFLKLLIDWPESLMTWDILFMLPTTWVGPVLAPCLNALTMIILGAALAFYNPGKKMRDNHVAAVKEIPPGARRLNLLEWALLASGSSIILFAYMEDYAGYVAEETGLLRALCPADTQEVMQIAVKYVPRQFNWAIFLAGQALLIFSSGIYLARMAKKSRSEVNL